MTFAGAVPGILGATIRDSSGLAAQLPGGVKLDPWTEAAPGAVLFAVPGVARYLASGGTTIDVEEAAGADRSSVELFLHGSARGSLIHQRGELPLEAATLVAPSGGAVAISSYSGIGKSTVAAELCRRGWLLIADDITRVTWTGGRVVAWPSHGALKLWRDACEKMGTDVNGLRRTRDRMEKYYVKMPAATSPTPLRAVIRLRMGPLAPMVDVPPNFRGSLLSESTFRGRQIAVLRQQEHHQRIAQQVAGSCRILIMSGAREAPSEALADQIVRATS